MSKDNGGVMAKIRNVYRVGISGSYGGWNLGDEAILQSMLAQLRRRMPVEVTVFTRDAEDTLRRHKVERAVTIRKLTRQEATAEIVRLDCFVLGGGGILFDSEAKTFLREVTIAIEKKIPFMVYAISAGPLVDHATQVLVRDCLNEAAVITVRERNARQLLEEIGVTQEIVVTADPALLLESEELPDSTLTREHLDGRKCLVGMSVREPGGAAPDISVQHYHALLANAADYMVDRFNAEIIFVPMEQRQKDVQHAHAVIAQMLRAQCATVLKDEYTSGQILSLMGNFAFAVGMRLHFLIFAALRNVPFVALPYASKVGGFLDDLKVTAPPIQLVNEGRLIAYIDSSWDRQNTLRTNIKRILPKIKRRAAENNEILVDLLNSIGQSKFRYRKLKKS
jgi:polysaccharide pyruvyl transferase CsaB